MNQPPAFQFYVDNFVQGTCDMEPAEVGVYIRLLCYQWSNGAIPAEKGRLFRVAGGEVSEHVMAKFVKGADGMLRNSRMERERAKQIQFRQKQAEFGKKGGRPRKGSLSKAFAVEKGFDKGSQSPPSPSPSPSPIAEREYVERPNLQEVQFHASTIGLGAWKAEDWYQEMEGCGWLDHNKRPVRSWKAILARVKTKWQSDGRPTSPPVNHHSNQSPPRNQI